MDFPIAILSRERFWLLLFFLFSHLKPAYGTEDAEDGNKCSSQSHWSAQSLGQWWLYCHLPLRSPFGLRRLTSMTRANLVSKALMRLKGLTCEPTCSRNLTERRFALFCASA